MTVFPMLNRGCQSLVSAPSQNLNSTSECFVTAPDFPCPILKTHGFSIVGEVDIPPSVTHLLGSCGPFAIFRRVSELIILAINFMFLCGRRSHIIGKMPLRNQPMQDESRFLLRRTFETLDA